MALDKFFSMFSGQFDCAMRDRSGGLCGGVRHKTSSRMNAPLDPTTQLQKLVHQRPHIAEGIPHHSLSPEMIDHMLFENQRALKHDLLRPELIDQMLLDNQMHINQLLKFPDRTDVVKTEVLFPYDPRFDCPDQSLHRLPSPGLSARDLSTRSPRTEMHSEAEREHLALRALERTAFSVYQGRNHELVLGSPGGSAGNGMEETGFPGELPSDFYHKLADLVARDPVVQERIAIGDMQLGSQQSLRSRFLQECIKMAASGAKDHADNASHIWKALEVCDKQDFLLAYSCGPPSPDFFANLIVPRYPASECGSSSTDFDARSTREPSECGSSSTK